MPRGFTWSVYLDDNGIGWRRQVDIENSADPSRGWPDTAAAPVQGYFPQRAKPRLVFGVSPTTGRRNYTVVAHVGAPLWTGAATTFVCETNSANPGEETDTYTVTRRRGESWPT